MMHKTSDSKNPSGPNNSWSFHRDALISTPFEISESQISIDVSLA